MLLSVPALAGSPRLNNLLPLAGQRGQSLEVTFYGERLHDVTAALVHGEGIAVRSLRNHEKDNTKRVHATIDIPDDAPLGEYLVRLVTATGVTEMVSFHVVARPIVNEERDEPSKNGKRFTQATTFDKPQVVPLGSVVLGRTESEDVDYYAIDLKRGQQFTAEVRGIRLGRGFTDSHLEVFGPDREQVAESDDTLLFKQDPFVSFVASRDGRYTIALRDSGYQGGNNNWYLIDMGVSIRPTLVYPLGGRPGQTLSLRMIGDAGGDFSQDVALPDQPDNAFEVMPSYNGKQAASGLRLRVNHLPNVLENPTQPNDTLNHTKAMTAHAVPVAINGVIEAKGDTDFYKIELKKDQTITLHCYANAMGSALDPVVNVFNLADNKHLQGNDDLNGPDSRLDFRAPADGAYAIRVRDHRHRGGSAFVYRLEITGTQPSLSTAITRYDRNRPQERQAIVVPRGNRNAALVTVDRSNVAGDLRPVIQGLPQGLAFEGLGPKEQANVMPVVFEADAQAPLDGKLVDLQAQRLNGGESGSALVGRFNQQTPLVVGDPNRTEYYHATIDTIPVAVTERIPFKIEVIEPKAPLVHGGKMKLQIKLHRDEGYDEQVRLYMLYRPSGIGATGRVDLNKTNTEGVYEIDANASTPTRRWPMVIVGNANQRGGPVWASSQLFEVRVEEPFVTGSIGSAKAKQGQSVAIDVELQHPRNWQGEGELKLLGLPARAEAEPVAIKPGQKTARLRIDLADNTPPGQHKSLMCELTIQVNGEPVVHRFGQGGRLRVDRAKTDLAQANRGANEN